MKFTPNHFSMIGLAVTAIGAIAAVVYYKNASASAAAADPGTSPLFQTAAIPSYTPSAGVSGAVGGSGGTSSNSGVTPAAPASGLTAGDIAGLLAAQFAGQNATQLGLANYSAGTDFTALGVPLISQIISKFGPGANGLNVSLTGNGFGLNLKGSYSGGGTPFYTPTPAVTLANTGGLFQTPGGQIGQLSAPDLPMPASYLAPSGSYVDNTGLAAVTAPYQPSGVYAPDGWTPPPSNATFDTTAPVITAPAATVPVNVAPTSTPVDWGSIPNAGWDPSTPSTPPDQGASGG